jgi:EAL domain-containing protein (putative c-di-GMP-specific phosphodiesterase class I)
MYQAKATGKSRWVVYHPAMRASALERLQIESELSRVIENDQLRLVYQPVVDLDSGGLVGFEALVRWEHPELGTILPDRFIPIAEQNDTIIAIGRWVLDEACRTAAGWIGRHGSPLTMAVNVSGRQLASSELLDHVTAALRDAGLEPSALVLEITETSLVQDPELAAVRLRALHALGVRLAIDDFGTGYSSLSYLRQFPVDILKIDRSFVASIAGAGALPPLVRGLLDLGRTLELEIVAEGIESPAQLTQLRAQHCQLGQGYLFARPMSADEAERRLDDLVRHVTPHGAGDRSTASR